MTIDHLVLLDDLRRDGGRLLLLCTRHERRTIKDLIDRGLVTTKRWRWFKRAEITAAGLAAISAALD